MLRALCIVVSWLVFAAHSQSSPPQPRVEPRTYALVSAVGSSVTLVRQRKQVGTLMEPYQRHEREVPGVALDAAVLRGLERIVREDDPGATFVYMKLNPAELAGAANPRKGEVALGKLATALEKMPGRERWHRILVVTPAYLQSDRAGMGEKLHGIGVFVQNAQKLPSNNFDFTRRKDETRALDGTVGESDRYVAPYFYAQVSVLDPKTLRVLEASHRWDFEKLFDARADTGNVEDAFPPEVLGARLERFVELSTAEALREAFGSVTVSEPRIIPPRP